MNGLSFECFVYGARYPFVSDWARLGFDDNALFVNLDLSTSRINLFFLSFFAISYSSLEY